MLVAVEEAKQGKKAPLFSLMTSLCFVLKDESGECTLSQKLRMQICCFGSIARDSRSSCAAGSPKVEEEAGTISVLLLEVNTPTHRNHY